MRMSNARWTKSLGPFSVRTWRTPSVVIHAWWGINLGLGKQKQLSFSRMRSAQRGFWLFALAVSDYSGQIVFANGPRCLGPTKFTPYSPGVMVSTHRHIGPLCLMISGVPKQSVEHLRTTYTTWLYWTKFTISRLSIAVELARSSVTPLD